MKRLTVSFFLFIFTFLSIPGPNLFAQKWPPLYEQNFFATRKILNFLSEEINKGKIGGEEIEENIFFLYDEKIHYLSTPTNDIKENRMKRLENHDFTGSKKNDRFKYIRIVPKEYPKEKQNLKRNEWEFKIELVNFKHPDHNIIVSIKKKLVKRKVNDSSGNPYVVVDVKK